ncbi:beta-lactamase/transpeptidase-like protein [Byssothecium circinans]|uniref:Beta-lactamase/transpeptidase-like protein n=1 Tax=Byssothecium circinans TaxID=147558 RepID=A0A6A5UKI4_9PLEO|nr:beta-lactamase/transpeptidase-like protein [Byssothecium circinans]
MIDALVARLRAQSPTIAKLLRVSGAPGLSYGIIHQGRIVFTTHMGRRDFKLPEPPNDDSIYHVASTFKIVSASVVAQLVTDGLLDWDVPIRQYLPTLKRDDEFGRTATLRDLLSNRTGLSMANCYWGQQNGEQLMEKRQFLEIIESIDAVKPMRKTFIYSQWNYILLQLIVEAVTGKSFGDYAREIIFEPLGMKTATFDDPAGTNIVRAHACRDDGSPSYVAYSKSNSSGGLAAGMGGKSSFSDQLKLYIAVLDALHHQTTYNVDSTPGSPFTQLRTIFTPHIPIPGSALVDQAYCLGLYRTKLPGNLSCASLNGALRKHLPIFGAKNPTMSSKEIFHHTANFPGFMGSIFLVPNTRSGVVVMTNATPLMDAPDFSAQLLLSVLLDIEAPKNYLELAHLSVRTQLSWFTQIQTALQTFKTDTPPTLPLPAYTGTYFNAQHNFKVVVTALFKGLRLSMQGLSTTYDVKPFDGDSFYFDANREWELIDRGMWFYPFPQFRVFHFDVKEDGVRSFTWQHDHLMDPETFTKDSDGYSSKL